MAEGITESSVQVQIIVDANAEKAKAELQSAQQAVDSLKASVSELAQALGSLRSFSGNNIATIADAFKTLNTSSESAKNIGANIESLASGVLGLSVIEPEEITSSTQALNALSSSLQQFETVNSAGIGALAHSLGDMTGAVERLSDTNITDNLPNLKTNLDGIADASSNAAQYGAGMAKLGAGV